MVTEQRGAVLVAVALGVLDGVLQQERHTAEGAIRQRAGDLGPGPVEPLGDDDAELRVELLDAGDGGVDHLRQR